MAARTEPTEPSRAVIEAAAFWQAQLADEECDEESRSAFRDWLREDRAHEIAFDRMNVLAGKVAGRGPVDRAALDMMLSRKRQGRSLTLLALVTGVTAMTWFASGQPDIRARVAGERTEIGEQRHATLAGGDDLTLDTKTSADIDDETRTVRLWQGGIMARVARGEPGAFTVVTPQGTARALGTQYSVRVESGVTTVAVIESRVEACASEWNRACLVLAAGQSARLNARGIHRIADIDPIAERSWSEGLLVADDRPLTEVIDTLNRYRSQSVAYSKRDLAGINVTGTFPLTDTDRALTSLKAALPIAIENDAEGTKIRRR